MEVLLAYMGCLGKSRKGIFRHTATKDCCPLTIQLCPGLLSFLLAHSMEAVSLRGLLEGPEKKKEVGKTLMQREQGPTLESDREELR